MNLIDALKAGLETNKPIRRPGKSWNAPQNILYRQLLNSNFNANPPDWWITEEDFFATDWEVQP